MRRWKVGDSHDFGSITLSIYPGDKAADDLVLKWNGNTRTPEKVPMAAAFYMVDFFAENEDALAQHRPFWRFNGDTYFLREVQAAPREGWLVVAERIEKQRRRRVA